MVLIFLKHFLSNFNLTLLLFLFSCGAACASIIEILQKWHNENYSVHLRYIKHQLWNLPKKDKAKMPRFSIQKCLNVVKKKSHRILLWCIYSMPSVCGHNKYSNESMKSVLWELYHEVESELNKSSIVVNTKKKKRKAKEQAGTLVREYTAHLLCDFEGLNSWHTRSVTQNPARPVLLS